jgi:shikimate dehydrogenase
MIVRASTALYALLGHPVGHSLSPVLQNGWIADHDVDAVYVALDVDPKHFETSLDGLFYAGLKGANVTIPFKERAAIKSVELGTTALAIGSANCLSLSEEGFFGDSTDGAGLIADLDARAPSWRDGQGPVVVLGAGGAARAILYALYQAQKTNIRLLNRNMDRANEIAKLVPGETVTVMDWGQMDAALEGASLVINATSAGLNDADPLIPNFRATRADCVVYDTVYVPRETAFLKAAKSQNRATLDGLGMLVGQGALAFKAWFGVMPDQGRGLARVVASLSS